MQSEKGRWHDDMSCQPFITRIVKQLSSFKICSKFRAAQLQLQWPLNLKDREWIFPFSTKIWETKTLLHFRTHHPQGTYLRVITERIEAEKQNLT